MTPRPWTPAALVILASCASAGSPSGAPALAYGVPVPATVGYEVGDSARVQLQAAGQSFALTASARQTWRMEFAPAGERTRITATLTDLEARATTPMTAPMDVDESAVNGPAVFTLDRRGRATVETPLDVSTTGGQFVTGPGLAHSFFPRLPDRPVGAGDGWVDTVAYEDDREGARTTVRAVTTYTVAGDSVVDGSRLLLVRTAGTSEQSTAGSIGGTDVEQSVSGSTRGHFLWDRAAGVLHSLALDSDLSGTMAVAIAPVALDVRLLGRVRVRRTPQP